MRISRRDFIHAGCTVAAVNLIPDPVEAWIHGSAVSSNNPNRVTLNVGPASWANLAKGFAFPIPPGIANSDGYPTTTPAANIGPVNLPWVSGYTGQVVWKWTGRGSMQMGPAAIIWSGGASVFNVGTNTGDVSGNFAIYDTISPRVVFSFGYNIQNLSQSPVTSGGNHLIRVTTKTGYLAGIGIGNSAAITIANQTGQAAATGTWTATVIDNQNMDLIGSIWDPSDPYTGPSGQALLNLDAIAGAFLNNNTDFHTGGQFSNLVLCKAANESAVDAGQIWDQQLVSQYQYLMNHATAPMSQRGTLRFMDMSGVQGSLEHDFANRMPATFISYAGNTSYFPPPYWSGTVTNTSDALTCSDPSQSVWGGSDYIDLAVAQGNLSAANSGALPTLAVGGHPARPIYSFFGGTTFVLATAPASAGLNMVWTFSASWLNGGTSYPFTYKTVSGDVGSLAQFQFNVATAMASDSVLSSAGQIKFLNGPSGGGTIIMYPRTAEAGVITVSYTSGPAIASMSILPANTLPTGKNVSFIYSKILGGWIFQPGSANSDQGIVVSIPFEAVVQLCNQVGAHCWYNWPVNTSAAFITSLTNFFGDATTGLTSGLKFMTEVGNELWNFSQAPFFVTQYLGFAMGFAIGSETPQWSWGALRTIQYALLSRTAWTAKGRALADHYILQMGRQAEAFPAQNFTQYGLEGAALSTSNAIYNAWSGLAGGAGVADYSNYPNRPVDQITATGWAAYWWSDYIRETAYSGGNTVVFGLVSDNAQWLQAAKDYANGSTASAFSVLSNLFTLARAGVAQAQAANWTAFATFFANFETIVANYDAGRAAIVSPKFAPGQAKAGILHYEGAPQWSFSTSALNGTNSTSDSTSLLALQYRIGSGGTLPSPDNTIVPGLNWDVSPYTISSTNSASEMAQMCLNLIQGWKLDMAANGSAASTGSYKNMIKTYYYQALVNASAASGREVKPAQYGYQQNIWGLFPGPYQLGGQYQNYDAIHEFNA